MDGLDMMQILTTICLGSRCQEFEKDAAGEVRQGARVKVHVLSPFLRAEVPMNEEENGFPGLGFRPCVGHWLCLQTITTSKGGWRC